MIEPPTNVAELRAAWRFVHDIEGPGDDRALPGWSMTAEEIPRLYVNGMIGGYRMNAGTFVQAVHAITATAIHLHVNSPGGFVWDAVSIYEALRSHPAKVTTHIDGLAGSAASFVALAGDTIEIARAGRMMIHDAQTVGLYADRAGGKAATWRKAMTATTWYSAQQAVDAGLAHRIAGADNDRPDNRTRIIQARHRALTTQGG
jgi:ATP-dependent protease ClpP protease subunit